MEEQKSLVKDSTFMRSVRSWEKNEQGEKRLLEKKQPVLPNWRKQLDAQQLRQLGDIGSESVGLVVG
jgi:hypothetical protein